MKYAVDHEVLSRSVTRAIARYPYFSTRPEKEGTDIVLKFNPLPIPVFNDGRCVVLGSEESNGHLLTFGCEGSKIFLNASHYIADGMGIDPLLKTVLYLYVSELYGSDALNSERINMPDSAVSDEEYEYPFPDEPFKINTEWLPKETSSDVYALNCESFDEKGLYAYHLRIPQKALMVNAYASDGSPVSFLSVMMYRTLCKLDSEIET